MAKRYASSNRYKSYCGKCGKGISEARRKWCFSWQQRARFGNIAMCDACEAIHINTAPAHQISTISNQDRIGFGDAKSQPTTQEPVQATPMELNMKHRTPVSEWLLAAIVDHPDFARAIGRGMATAGVFAIVIGALFHVAAGTMSTMAAIGGAHITAPTEASSLVPGYIAVWIPESAAGYVFSGAIAAIGLWLAITARNIKRAGRPFV